MVVYVRKINGVWHTLNSPSGDYPAGGYVAGSTGCKTKKELIEYLELAKGYQDVTLVSI